MEENAKTSESEANTFAELGLNEWLVNQCTAVGMIKPTPIQRNCVPKIIEGEKVCVGDNMETFRCACGGACTLAASLSTKYQTWTCS